MQLQQAFDQLKCCVVIPTYNNAKTLPNVVEEVLQYTTNILVINDGATDENSLFTGKV